MHPPRRTPARPVVRAARLLGIVCLAATSSCSEAATPETPDTRASEPLAQFHPAAETRVVADENGAYLAEISAGGTSCPPGSWKLDVAPDGHLFTFTFSNFAAEVGPGVREQYAVCMLRIKLTSGADRAYSVQTFGYSGYAALDRDVHAVHDGSFYFGGRPMPASGHVTELTGPYDGRYDYVDDGSSTGRGLSPCGREQYLFVNSRMWLQNPVEGYGYMALTAADPGTKLVVRMQSHRCTAQPSGDFGAVGGPSTAPDAGSDPVIGAVGGPTTPIGAGQPPAVIGAVGGSDPAAPTSALPSWARPLLGRYAVRTDGFSQSPVGPMLSGRQLSMVEFVQVDDHIEQRTRLCDHRSESLGYHVSLRSPAAYPEIRRRVTLHPNERWSTDSSPVGIGYERVGYAGCIGRRGQNVPKRPEQTWIRGSTCHCGGLVEEPELDDCRVTDPDRDGKPGMAYTLTSPAGNQQTSHAAMVTRSNEVSGRVDPNGSHFAQVRGDEVTYQLLCEPNGCDIPIVARPCTSEHNAAQYARLPAPSAGQPEWTCETLRAQEARLFARPRLATPRSCTRDEFTDEP